jgi:hypothetical protein
MEKKISIVICAFDNWKRVERALRRLDSFDLDGFERMLYIFNPGYPLPSKQENKAALLELADKHCAYYQDIENRGQVGNFRQIAEQIKTDGSQVYLFWDADHNPAKKTWFHDAWSIFQAEDRCDFITMNHSIGSNFLQHQKPQSPVGGIAVRRLVLHGGFPIFIFRKSFIQDYPQPLQQYGGDEWLILEKLKRDYKVGYMMEDHDDLGDYDGIDKEYVEWKKHAIDKKEAMSFEIWLKEKQNAAS